MPFFARYFLISGISLHSSLVIRNFLTNSDAFLKSLILISALISLFKFFCRSPPYEIILFALSMTNGFYSDKLFGFVLTCFTIFLSADIFALY